VHRLLWEDPTSLDIRRMRRAVLYLIPRENVLYLASAADHKNNKRMNQTLQVGGATTEVIDA